MKQNFPSLAWRRLSLILTLLLVAACSAPRQAPGESPAITTQAEDASAGSPSGETPEAAAALPDTAGTLESTPPSFQAPSASPETQAGTATLPATRTPAPTVTPLPTQEWRPISVSGCPITQAPEVSEQATVELGPAPGIPPTNANGDRLVIVGTVYAADCTPLPDASLNVWQTDAYGEYGPGHDSNNMQCCYLQGQVTTDENGHYQLNTIRPGHYAGEQVPPPAHIHVEISHPSAGNLMTEIVFADDPYLGETPLDGYIVVAPEPFAGPDGAYLYTRGVADIVLPGSQPAGSPAPAASASASSATGSGLGRRSGVRTFEILPQASEAAYHIRERFAVFSIETKAVAVTRQVQGRLEIDLSDPQILRSLEMEVDLRGLKSDDPNRDEKLFDRWLVTNAFPMASFTATMIENPPQDYQEGQPVSFTLHGDMTIRDITRPITFQVTARLSGDTLIGTATGVLKMTGFGIDPPNLLDFVVVEDEVGIVVNIVAEDIRPGSSE